MDDAFDALFKQKLEYNETWRELSNQKTSTNDRSRVLILHAILDHKLQEAIATHFVTQEFSSVFGGRNEAALSSTSSKIVLSYHLGIIPAWMRNDLRNINDVRNLFAHSPQPLDFDRQEIQDKCSKLSASKVHRYSDDRLRSMIGEKTSRQLYDAVKFLRRPHGGIPDENWQKEFNALHAETEAPHPHDSRHVYWATSIIIYWFLLVASSEQKPFRYKDSESVSNIISDAAPP